MSTQPNAASMAPKYNRDIDLSQQQVTHLDVSIISPPSLPPMKAAQSKPKLPPGREWPASLPFGRLLTRQEHLSWALQEAKEQFRILHEWVQAVHPYMSSREIEQKALRRWLWLHWKTFRTLCYPDDDLCDQILDNNPIGNAADAILTHFRLLYLIHSRRTKTDNNRPDPRQIDAVIRTHASHFMLWTSALHKRLSETKAAASATASPLSCRSPSQHAEQRPSRTPTPRPSDVLFESPSPEPPAVGPAALEPPNCFVELASSSTYPGFWRTPEEDLAAHRAKTEALCPGTYTSFPQHRVSRSESEELFAGLQL